jgi:hypothetical protein
MSDPEEQYADLGENQSDRQRDAQLTELESPATKAVLGEGLKPVDWQVKVA